MKRKLLTNITSGNGKAVLLDGRRQPYLQGPKVDPSDVLPDGRTFKDIDELKQLLLADTDKVARALTRKLLTYATGGASEPADAAAIGEIVGNVKAKNYGLRSLINEIVQNKLFQEK